MPLSVSRITFHTSRLDRYRLLLFAGILLYTVIFTQLAFAQHLGMRTHRSDLGQIDQAVWNSSRGRFLENTDNGAIATRLTDHVEPVLVLISPIFWLWDDVRALLVLQVVMVAIGAWPLYELALLRLDQLLTRQERMQIWHAEPLRQLTRPLALALVLAYFLAPQLQSAVLTEFHAVPLAVPLILWAFWAIETGHWWQFAVAALLLAGVKEETALLAAGLGVWGLWQARSKDTQHASRITLPVTLSIVVLSLAWFYIATFIIVPAHAVEVYGVAESGYFARYGALGDSPLDIFKSFFTQPGLVWQIVSEPARVKYLWGLLAPFGFLSLLAPELILLAFPVLLANLLSAYPAQYYGEFHYSAPLAPYFAVSAAYGLGRLWRWLGRRASSASPGFQHMPAAGTGTMALVALFQNARTALRPVLAALLGVWVISWAISFYGTAGRGPLGGRYDPTPITSHHRQLANFVTQIPAAAAVTATAAVHPHVSHRRYVYQFPLGLDAPVPADWALLDVTTNTDMAPGDVKTRVDEMLAADWGVVDAADGYLLMRKDAKAKIIPDAFFTFARATDAKIAQFQAGSPLTFAGISFEDWSRWRQSKVNLFWQVGENFSPGAQQFQTALVTPDGEVVYSLGAVTPPARLWYPPERWQPGEKVKLTTPWLYLPRVWGVLLPTPVASSGQLDSIEMGQEHLVGVYQRDHAGKLAPLPLNPLNMQTLANSLAANLTATSGRFQVTTADFVEVMTWLPRTAYPNKALDIWLQWQVMTSWPGGWTPFVHLRQDGNTLTQADGQPRFFVPYAVDAWLRDHEMIPDWRVIAVPADAPPGATWQLIIGLYNPPTGQRADVIDAAGNVIGNELVIGEVEIGEPPVPDQACALIPATCASQPAHAP